MRRARTSRSIDRTVDRAARDRKATPARRPERLNARGRERAPAPRVALQRLKTLPRIEPAERRELGRRDDWRDGSSEEEEEEEEGRKGFSDETEETGDGERDRESSDAFSSSDGGA